jgi:hypothetical protein
MKNSPQPIIKKKTVSGMKLGHTCPACNKFVSRQDAWYDAVDGFYKHKNCLINAIPNSHSEEN